MESCPFCSAAIDEELLLYGGTCPNCLNEIPGEEAPTDPGAQAHANAELEAEAARQGSRMSVMAIAIIAVLVVSGGFALYLSTGESDTTSELPEIVINRDLDGHINPDAPEDEKPEEVAANTPSERPVRLSPPTGGQISAPSEAAPDRGSIGPSAPTGGINSFDPGVAINPLMPVGQAKILTSDADIDAMVANTLGTYTSRLQKCYNRRLKERADLKGTWNISFTINRQGKTSAVSVAPRGTADAELEACLLQSVQRFSFQKIVKEKPVSFPVRFGV